jgi:hypothetical protein
VRRPLRMALVLRRGPTTRCRTPPNALRKHEDYSECIQNVSECMKNTRNELRITWSPPQRMGAKMHTYHLYAQNGLDISTETELKTTRPSPQRTQHAPRTRRRKSRDTQKQNEQSIMVSKGVWQKKETYQS